MSKLFVFLLGLSLGFVVLLVAGICLNLDFSFSMKTALGRKLSERIESIPVEDICRSIASDKQILGEDHVTACSDGHRYLVVGWQVQKPGTPIFYWTGAGLPDDIAECKKLKKQPAE